MKAVRIHEFGGADVLSLEEMPKPTPGPGEVLIRVVAASVNPIDYKIRSGDFKPPGLDLPLTPGRDVSGVIEAVGPGVNSVLVGDEVYGLLDPAHGAYAEYAVARAEDVACKPVSIDHPHAAAVPLAAITAWQGLFDHGKLKAGERVLIHGAAGGVGHFAVQFAKDRGAYVVATGRGEDRDRLRKWGADDIIDYQHERFEERARDIDLVLDLVDGETQQRSWSVLKEGGRLVSTLAPPSQEEAKRLHAKGEVFMAQPNRDELVQIGQLIDDGRVSVRVEQMFPLADAGRAQQHLERDHVQGKVVLTMEPEANPPPLLRSESETRSGPQEETTDSTARWLFVAAIVVGIMIAFAMTPAGALVLYAPWLWLTAFLLFILALALFAPGARERPVEQGPHMLTPEEQPPVVREVMDVRLAEEEHGIRWFRGRLRGSADAAFERLKRGLGNETLPLLQPDERSGAAILLMPRATGRRELGHRVRPWLHWLLFALTFVTTTWAGAAHQGIDLLREPSRFTEGVPYALALLAILGVHELGHYWTARRNGMSVTPPYFIPVPFALGTFGAFIQMRSPAENRRTLFDVAIAGPLAGLAVAIPALLIGFRNSQVLPAGLVSEFAPGVLPGSSIMFTLLARLSLGPELEPGSLIQLSPMAFAGWLGLFITGLNLLPIGQLDGGHIARAMFGSRAGATIGAVAMWSLVLLGLLVWPGLLTWALIVFFIAGRGTPPLNDITPIGTGRKWLGALAFAILLLVLVPMRLVSSFLNHSPYA